ncbi:MAG: nucleotide exchange factor GrpE [Patescibacteria group bacterium]|nr:nucleotide exchange factor GrpE [Patescibacteria group bacterium]
MHKHKEQQNENQAEPKDKCPQCDEYLNGWKRALADYENLKKQTAKEKEEFAKFANTNLIIGLIPVYNNLKISFGHLPADLKNNNWVKGIEHIRKQMLDVLEFNGVEEIVPKIGEKFNPELHEAVKSEEQIVNSEQITDDKQQTTDHKIVKVLSDGYKLNGRVFMPAKVVVA